MATSFEPIKAQKARFADFELDLSSGELIRDGRRFRLQGQPFRVLCILLERFGQVVTREELQHRLWPDETFVDFDHGLNKAIAKLREALEDSKASSRLIETIPRRGYRLNVEVNWVGPTNGRPVPHEIPQREMPPQEGTPRFRARYRLMAGIALALLLGTATWFNRRTISSWFSSRPSIQSVAVLPLANLSNDPEYEYFADGMTEQLITDLSYAKPLRVLSRSSTMGFKNSPLSVPEIAEQLHVDALIEGTVLRVNDTIRVTIRLTAVRPEQQLWAASYERNRSDAITLQNQLAADAVRQMRAELSPAGQTQLSLESKISPEAYDEYLRGRFFIRQEASQKDTSIPHLERAIQLDPNFAAAYAAMGEACAMEVLYGQTGVAGSKSNREWYAKALDYSQKAVNLDPTSSEAYSSLGHSLMQNHRWKQAEATLRRAIELDANNPNAADYLALVLAQNGRTEESIQVSRELALANPVAINFRRVYAMSLYMGHRFDEAIAESERLIELQPNHAPTNGLYVTSLVEKGRFQEAEAAFPRSQFGKDPGARAWLYVREGNTAAARKILEENTSAPPSPFGATAHYLLGEQERALKELDYLANEAMANKTYFLRTDPIFDPMRNNPRFTEIVKKTGLLDN
jgi:TolB-like protein/DNA-binding winged helix-turn-helix (wHTH) protein/Flp pilus assembly protein TadD